MVHWIDPYSADDVRAMLACLHPQVEFRPLLLRDSRDVYRGRSGVADWLLRVRNSEPRRSLLVDEVCSLPDGRVLVVGTMVFGRRVRATFCALNELRDGLLVKVQHWLTTPETLERLGYVG
jgi:ketosteroid isomerase-like protein